METAAIKNCEIAFGGKNVNWALHFTETIRYTQESISRDD